MSPFPLHDEVITSAVEIEKDKIMVSIEGRNKLFVIDVATRMAIKAIVNPTTISRPLVMIPAPGYNSATHPWVFLKDTRFISVVNTKDKRILPLIRSPNDCDMRKTQYLIAEPVDPRN